MGSRRVKRSEFIDKMLIEFRKIVREPETDRELCGMLLDMVERLGMLPPIQWGKKPSKVKEVCKWDADC